jgi:putative dimethyl sulfoxide reductase chaperone
LGSFADLDVSNDEDPSRVSQEREEIYQILATSFYPPVKGVTDKLWKNAISKWNPEGGEAIELNPLDLRLEYNRLFVGPGTLACPPYESVYRRDRPESERGMLMSTSVIDVKKRYGEAGIGISGNFSDLLDHIAVELEFMCFLCAKEVEARTSGGDDDIWKRRQAEFWKFHLNPWIGEFSESLLKNAKSPFYKAAAALLKEWFEVEGEAFSEYLGA